MGNGEAGAVFVDAGFEDSVGVVGNRGLVPIKRWGVSAQVKEAQKGGQENDGYKKTVSGKLRFKSAHWLKL